MASHKDAGVATRAERPSGPLRSAGYPIYLPGSFAALQAVPWLIRGLIPHRALVSVIAEPSAGKTLHNIQLACSIATGRLFFGRRTRRLPVMYVASESEGSVQRRILAWAKRNRIPIENIDIVVVGAGLNLTNDDSVARHKSVIDEYRPELLIVDTLACSMVGDENSSSGMGLAVLNLLRIRDDHGLTVIVTHHTAHEKTKARGHTSLLGAVDVEILVTRSDGKHRAKITKSRDGAIGECYFFGVEVECIGLDADGEPLHAPVLVPGSTSDAPADGQVVPLDLSPKPEEEALGILQALIAESGADMRFDGVARRVVPLAAWRAMAEKHFESQSAKAKDRDSLRRRFGRHRDKLADRRLIEVLGNYVALPMPPVPSEARKLGLVSSDLGKVSASDIADTADI